MPQEHRDFRADVLKDHDIDGEDLRQQTDDYSNWGENMQESGATKMLQIGFDHGVGCMQTPWEYHRNGCLIFVKKITFL